MINPEKSFNIQDYGEIFLRRIWFIIIPFAVILIAAGLYAIFCPREYRATATILIVPQKVPEAFIKPTVTAKIEERIQSLGQEVMSRGRLERVINEFKLYQDDIKSDGIEVVLETMRSNIQIEVPRKEKEKTYFTISFIDTNPRIAATVANRLASLFIEENLKFRESQAQGTAEFIFIELGAAKTKLEEQEKAIAAFKKRFMGELPEQKEANNKILDQLQALHQRINENIRAGKDRILVIQKQIADTEDLIATSSGASEGKLETPISTPVPVLTKGQIQKNPSEIQLEKEKNYLLELQSKYTEKHPDVLAAKKKIAELESKIEKGKSEIIQEEKKEDPEKKDESTHIKVSQINPSQELKLQTRRQELESLLVATKLEIERLKEEEGRVKNQINKYRERIENTPLREHELQLLTRDYQTTRETFQALSKKSEDARQAENMERRQKGEQFRVIDPATPPEKPVKPNVLKIVLFGLLSGAVGGIGIGFMREQMDRSFRDAEDLEASLGFKVLANIPKVEEKAD